MQTVRYFVILGFIVLIPLLYIMSRRPKKTDIKWNYQQKTNPKFNLNDEHPNSATTSSLSKVDPQKTYNEFVNVHFKHKGKTYDAYEVLNIAAGSTLINIEKSFNSLKSVSSGDELDRMTMAFEAIKKNY